MGKRDARPKGMTEERTNEESTSSTYDGSEEANARAAVGEAPSLQATTLATVLEELRDFRKDFQNFKSELTTITQKMTEAETRIENVEDRVQCVEQVLTKMIKIMSEQENKLLDQESRSRRVNLRLYNVREGAENEMSMADFVEKLLRDSLDIPLSTSLGIERAHRALGPKPSGKGEEKPRSIIIRFARFITKEDILRKAWAKKTVLWEGRRIYFDQDFPPVILQKRKEYTEAKQVLKRHNIRFQTPFPYKLRVFYEKGTRLYQSAEEATTDMIARGMPVTKIKTRESLAEQLARTAWTVVGGQQRRDDEETREQAIREKLQAYRRSTSLTTED